MNNEIFYSADACDWSELHTCIEEAARCAFDEMNDKDRKNLKKITMYQGLRRKARFEDFLCINSILEEMEIVAYDNAEDLSFGYLEDVTDSEKESLENLIIKWASTNNIEPHWYTVEDIKEVEFKIPDDWVK
jgi:hypothetical protein